MPKLNFSDEIVVVEVEHLKSGRFSFIEDVDLRTNIAISAQYLTFLFSLEEAYTLSGALKYSLFKTLIVYSASIVEALLCYELKRTLKREKLDKKKILKIKKEYRNIQEIHKIDESKRVIGGLEKAKIPKWTELNFQEIIRAAKRSGILDSKLYESCDELRKKRNKIHIVSVKDGEDLFEKDEVKEIFLLLGEIINIVKMKK